MLARRRVPFGTSDDSILPVFNPSSDLNRADLTALTKNDKVRPTSAKEYSRISAQDRTVEFLSVIKYSQARNPNYRNISNTRQKQMADEFQVISSKIGKDITSTSEKLESLNLIVAKRRDAEGHELANQLTDIIRQDLNMFNKQIAQLQQFLRHQMFNKHKMAHSNSVIVALQSKLVKMSTNFKVILELKQQNVRNFHEMAAPQQNIPGFQYATNWREARNFGNTHNNNNHSNNVPPRSLGQIPPNYPPLSSSHQPKQQYLNNYQSHVPQNNPAFYTGEHQQGHNPEEHQQRGSGFGPSQALRQRYVQEDRSKDEMVEIEQTIVELGGIFQQLTSMVHEQGEMVQRIDSHIDDAHLNIDLAHSELVKYFGSVASMRGLMLKVFAVLFIFIIFFFFFYL